MNTEKKNIKRTGVIYVTTELPTGVRRDLYHQRIAHVINATSRAKTGFSWASTNIKSISTQ